MASTTANDIPEVEPNRLGRPSMRIGILGSIVFIVFAALFLRLWALQVLSGPKYVGQTQRQAFLTVRVQPPRGTILDRYGRPLVMNSAATVVQLWPSDLPTVYSDRRAELGALARATQVPLYELSAIIKSHRNEPFVTIREPASKGMVAYLSERASQFPGVTLGRAYIRHYPYGSLAAQVLGYTGEISQAQLNQDAKSGYVQGDVIGQAGLEASYDSYLRGEAGAARLHVDSLGRPRSAIQLTTLPKPGHDLRITLDMKLQQAAERALQYGIQLARNNGKWAASGGAIVAMDPSDGAILAMASAPTYEPSVFTGRVTERQLAAQGLTPKTALAKNYPSLNRNLQGLHPPGSTFKPVTALAGMEEHMFSPYAYRPCTGTFSSPQDRSHRTFHNWDPNVNQQMDLPTALAYSCDTYFYRLGNQFYNLPADRGQPLQRWAEAFGFGQLTNTGAGPEVQGLVPTIGWREATYTSISDPRHWQVDRLWKPGDSIELAIGQGNLLVTPLQLTRFYALLANGGKLVQPHLLLDVENPNGTAVPVPSFAAPKSVGIDPAALAVVRQGLVEGTHLPFGTSYGVFGQFPVSVAGKT
ncbi:MAG TPA: penicillin-binding transpeptidase domain-containing protein [Gaiellaceae bacterium]|nr:penicillin-binding transpeptidase domain-containing protein [Gaiellaceae bacterium]